MAERKHVARWRRTPREGARVAVVQRRGSQLRLRDKVLLTVGWAQPMGVATNGGWIWYGMGQNTHATMHRTAEDAKAAADAWYKVNEGAHGNG